MVSGNSCNLAQVLVGSMMSMTSVNLACGSGIPPVTIMYRSESKIIVEHLGTKRADNNELRICEFVVVVVAVVVVVVEVVVVVVVVVDVVVLYR